VKKLIYSQEDLDLILSLETETKDKEIERLNKGINEIIQYINSLELGSDQEPYNKEGYAVSVYDIEKMLVDLIGSDKE